MQNRSFHYTRFVFLLVSVFVVASERWELFGQDSEPASETIAPEQASGFRKVPLAKAKNFMVAAAHPLASRAGFTVLKNGGGAVDAMIATQAMLTLVEPQSSGIGGGAFLVVYNAKTGKVAVYDGRETAPAKATDDLFLDKTGKPLKFYDAVVGGRSVGTPGVLRMLEAAHQKHGRLKWKTLFEDAIHQAERGFQVTPRLQHLLKSERRFATDSTAHQTFFTDNGNPISVGSTLKNVDLAKTFRAIAEQGADAFYTGPIAEDIVAAVQGHANAGLLELADLKAYRAIVREPVRVRYRGYEIYGCPPPTSGGVTTLQILKLLERFDLGDDPQSPRFLHLLAEAERLAYADRARYLADPDFIDIPTHELLAEKYLKKRSALIRENEAAHHVQPGKPEASNIRRESGKSIELPSTSHVSIVDAQGNIACMTSSIENVFGSRVMVRGFLLNNQLTDFSFAPTDQQGAPIANAVAANKRPRSSMAPIIVFDKSGSPMLILGSPGGSRIIGYVAQTLIHVLDFEFNIQRAIDLPHLVNRNGVTEIEDHPLYQKRIDRIASDLKKRGHQVIRNQQTSGIHAIAITADGLQGGADPRREGVVVGE